MKVRVQFDRIGRDHSPGMADFDVDRDLTTIEHEIYMYVKPKLASREVDVLVERQTHPDGSPMEGGYFTGTIYAGSRTAGAFTGWEVSNVP